MSIEVVTFGCRLNAYDSEVIRREATAEGVTNTLVVNTCAVTAEAVRQARQAIRRLRRERPGLRIVVTGCAAQIEPATFAAMPEVALVLGNEEKTSARAWHLHRAALARLPFSPASAEQKVSVSDIMMVDKAEARLVDGFEGRSRAFVRVQDGCDHRCTFCVIPYARGNSRSVPMGRVVEEVRQLVEKGYREVVLTGVDLTSFGSGLPGTPRLGTLVKKILKHVPELARLRLSSIDSVEADPELLDALAGEERLMPHLHLSLQSGDDLILKRMKRRHQRADAVSFCDRVRRLRPDIVFGADIIAGFPTETEEMFARSLSLIEDCELTYLHVFPFSARPGTPAARMPQLPHQLAKDRARRLRERGATALRAHLDAQVGRAHSVLLEAAGVGRTGQFTPIRLDATRGAGTIVEVVVTGHDGRQLLAA